MPETLEILRRRLVCTGHDGVDYQALVRCCLLVIDTRNETKNIEIGCERIVKV